MNRRNFRRAGGFAALLVAWLTAAVAAHEGDPHTELAVTAAYAGPKLKVGAAEAAAALSRVVELLADQHSQAGQQLLPSGVTVDEARWDGGVLNIKMTLPQSASDGAALQWGLSPIDIETISRALTTPFRADSEFGGTRTLIRRGPTHAYENLEAFLSPAQAAPLLGIDQPDARLDLHLDAWQTAATPRGPVAHGGRQPPGALSGVTVFVSAGHGWTAGASSWFLQRPLLLGMCEDYGNIDQINLFVHYLFNAGATVVPFRPVGWQPVEIVLDNDDPGVSFSGAWSDGVSSKYYENGVTNSGVVYRAIGAMPSESATARYTPLIPVSDYYPVFCFAVGSDNRTHQTYRVAHSGGVSEIRIDHRNVGSGWIWLGDYYLEAGGANYVEITNESTQPGAVIADAIRWGDGQGDVVRPGPGSISGYPRDQEGQRYWAESEWGNNAAGFDSGIWDLGGFDDNSDNVGAAARAAREMNQAPAGGVQVDRWKRCHVEFHTNAFNGGARGQICLITDTGSTTNQTQFATIVSDEVDADMTVLSSEFEHAWVDRASPTLTGSYGAISTGNNSNEFDATLVELAFHDNPDDADLLRSPRVRDAMAKSVTQGVIRFLNTLPGSQVPIAFAPDRPRTVRVRDAGNGDIVLAWEAPLSDSARGDPATGYVVYQSRNGLGFGDPLLLGNVLTTTISGVPAGETRYFRIAATNAGGESMPSETLAVRRPATGVADVLIVNGFDRLRRQQNPTQSFTQPPAYAGQSIERQMWRASNAFDYVVEHAEALAANGDGFASCSNEAVSNSLVQLGGYRVVDWILGNESNEDATLTQTEQTRLTDFLLDGGALFISGSDIAHDLIDQGRGPNFAQNMLQIGFSANDALSTVASPAASSILSGLSSLNFSLAAGAPYRVLGPDVLTVGPDGRACLNYGGGVAGVEHRGSIFNTVTFAFPFETIGSPALRAQVMERVIDFLRTATGPLAFDFDRDGDIDFDDFSVFLFCFQAPGLTFPDGHICRDLDGDADRDVDLHDFALFQRAFTGP